MKDFEMPPTIDELKESVINRYPIGSQIYINRKSVKMPEEASHRSGYFIVIKHFPHHVLCQQMIGDGSMRLEEVCESFSYPEMFRIMKAESSNIKNAGIKDLLSNIALDDFDIDDEEDDDPHSAFSEDLPEGYFDEDDD